MALASYTIGKVIGKGSYGEVSLVKHVKDRKQYVIKKVDLQKASSRERKSAELEAKLLSQLRHPNIVSYRDSFQDDDGFLYIVMNFCEGGDLYTMLKSQKGKLMEETRIVEWFVQIAMALQYMHERHILHRDLKTQNIFLTKSGIVKVGDLGIARVLENSSDMATTLIGTPYYMSPELFSNKPYNHKSDVWALGCVLYETCTLKHAFNARDMNSLVYKILKGKIPAMPKQYSDDLCKIIRTMLEQEPEKRPSVSRLLRDPYIKQQIALFLEGTKSRQKQRKSSGNKLEKKSIDLSPLKHDNNTKSDCVYNGSNNKSIATVSAVNCVINGDPLCNKPSKNSAQDSDGRISVESTSSSGSSEKGQTEVHAGVARPDGNKADGAKQEPDKNERKKYDLEQGVNAQRHLSHDVKRKELIKRQWEKRKQNNERGEQGKELRTKEKIPNYFDMHERPKNVVPGEEKAARLRVKNGKSKKSDCYTPGEHSRYRRPLPKPPSDHPGDVPLSKSPRSRRRYKVASVSVKSHASEDVEEERRSSVDSDKSDTSSVSVSESTPQSCGLTARERRRLKQRSAEISNPPTVQELPSPREVLAARAGHLQARVVEPRVTPPTGNVSAESRGRLMAGARDAFDGPRKVSQSESLSAVDEQSGDSTGSELEEISVDEPTPSQKRKVRKESDVSCLISALDTTLKLSTPDRGSPETQKEEEEEELQEKPVGTDLPDGASPTRYGRLPQRIERLRSECIKGIGLEVLNQAYTVIDTNDEDHVEEALVRLMGRENFERYGGQIWQLKFCESFRVN